MTSLLPLAAFCVLVLPIPAVAQLIRGYKTGVISAKGGGDVERSEHPKWFWFYAAYYFLLIAIAIFCSVMLVLLDGDV